LENDLKAARFSFAFGFILFAANFFYVFLTQNLPFEFMHIMVAVIIGIAKPVYEINPALGVYFIAFNIFYQFLWLLVTLIGILWLVFERKEGMYRDFLDAYLERLGNTYNKILAISVVGPILAIILFQLIIAVLSLYAGRPLEIDWTLIVQDIGKSIN